MPCIHRAGAPRPAHFLFWSCRHNLLLLGFFFFFPSPFDSEASRTRWWCRTSTWSAFLSSCRVASSTVAYSSLQRSHVAASANETDATRLSQITSGLLQRPLPLDLSSIVRLHSEFSRLVCSLLVLACYFGGPPVSGCPLVRPAQLHFLFISARMSFTRVSSLILDA